MLKSVIQTSLRSEIRAAASNVYFHPEVIYNVSFSSAI